jgi:hypothetical protein
LASEQFSLILGCGGYKHYDMTMCAGTYNIIINFNRHFDAEELKKIMDFLDFACNLFDRPMGDWNKIVNTLKLLRERHHLLNDKTWEGLHLWLPQHKHCGAFLRLIFNADIESTFRQSQENLIEPDYIECPTPPTIEPPIIEKKIRKSRKARDTEKKALAPVLKTKKS